MVAHLLGARRQRAAGVRRRLREAATAVQVGQASWRPTGSRTRSSDVMEAAARLAASLKPAGYEPVFFS